MTRLLQTALQIETQAERQTWIDSLSEDERKEFSSELSGLVSDIVIAFQPVIEVFQNAANMLSVWCSDYEAAQKDMVK